jgi:hypothetical protein
MRLTELETVSTRNVNEANFRSYLTAGLGEQYDEAVDNICRILFQLNDARC